PSALVIAFVACATLFTSPIIGLLFAAGAVVVGIVLAPYVVISSWFQRGRRTRLAMIGATYAAFATIAVYAVISERSAQPAEFETRDLQTLGAKPTCVLSGYSTVDTVNIRSTTAGTWQYLTHDCDRCRGGVAKYGQTGQTFSAIRPVACSRDSPLK